MKVESEHIKNTALSLNELSEEVKITSSDSPCTKCGNFMEAIYENLRREKKIRSGKVFCGNCQKVF